MKQGQKRSSETSAGIIELMRGAIVLAGGPSSRFERNKALVELGHKPLIRYVIDACQTVVDRIAVAIAEDDDSEAYARVLPAHVELVRDVGKYKNPLNGMASGMEKLDAAYSVVLPCDTPFIRSEILEFLFEKASGFDAAIPVWPNDYIEPLHAVYKIEAVREALPRIIQDRNSRVSSLIRELASVKYVRTEEIKQFDRRLTCFLNINSLQDLELARASLVGPATVQITI